MEIWKDIKDFEGLYQVSNLGRVKRITKSELIMKLTLHKKTGYFQVGLRKGKKRKTASVHRLVAQAFCKNPQSKNVVNHINGIKTDNNAFNLEWVTKQENEAHAVEMGLRNDLIGENNIMSKLTEDQVLEVYSQAHEGSISQTKIAEKFGVCQACVSSIKVGKIWSHITGVKNEL